MSKKSRRRNKRILGALGALGALALMGRRKGTAFSRPEAGTIDQMAKDNMPKTPKRNTVVKTPTTIQDSMPKVGMKKGDILPKNVKSKRITDKGEVYTIQDAKKGIPKKIGNKKTAFVNKDYIYQDGMPYTKGRYGTFKAKQEMDRGMLPPQLRTPDKPNLTTKQGEFRRGFRNFIEGIRPSDETFMDPMLGDTRDIAAKDGGRITKKGVKRGAAKRGFGRAYKKGKR